MVELNWPTFPNATHMRQDSQGRPETQNLIPGKQLGTEIDEFLLNPLIHKVCDITDALKTVQPAGDYALNSRVTTVDNDLQNFKADAVTGHGYSDNDKRITNIWANNDKDYPRLQANVGTDQTLVTARIEDVTKETARAQSAEATLVSGTLGTGPNDKAGRGLHTSASGHAFYWDDSGAKGDLAYLSDVTDETTRAKSAEATLVSGTLGMGSTDKAGRGLHTSASGRPNYWDTDGTKGDLAYYNDVTTVSVDLQNFKADAVTGHGYSDGDLRVTNVWANKIDKNRPRLQANIGTDQSLITARIEDITDETARAQSAEATLVSGTLGTGPNDKAGRGLHTSTSGRPNYWDIDGTKGDLAYYKDVTTVSVDLQNFKADAITGHGYNDGDLRVTNIWANKIDKNRPRLQANIGTDQSLITARVEDITDETARAQSAEATLVSGTLGMGSTDKAGRGLHTSASGHAFYWDETGARGYLAYYASLIRRPLTATQNGSTIVPDGVTQLIAEIVGGGGAGGSCQGRSLQESVYAAGGGAGGYLKVQISVSPEIRSAGSLVKEP
ncbi:hypothetical protein GT348_07310 [Aristophania vespae]|uniref:Uncharacterized protein n=1 Tax=Aristophania vespae TaxID=2697033 RepID=A0A6P1NHR1_9PROT|nr:hypothetical protein [Aristophania vespae]QHI96070.1 hypothetical protein GT348_07310 [Aristophania vespae]